MSRLKPPRFVFFLGAVEEPCVLRISSICVTWCIQMWDSFVCVTCSFILEAWLIRTWDLAHSYTRAVQIPKRALHIFKRALHIVKRALHILKTSPHLEKSPTTSQTPGCVCDTQPHLYRTYTLFISHICVSRQGVC